jgi:NtrC-family two-component system response regulator AlgB
MDFLVIDDDKTFRDATCFLIEEEGHSADGAESGQLGLSRLKEDKYEAVLLDLNLGRENGLEVLTEILKQYPDLPIVMFTAQGSIKIAVESMQRGAVDFLEKPFQREQFLTVLARLKRLRRMGQRIERLEQEVTETKAESLEPIFDFKSAEMSAVMEVLLRAARTPASVLILGESGTGKSVAARALHRNSHLADKPFITVSCPSLSRELLDSDLFGHVRGAFTGAVKDRWGKVKTADGGTLFLDEIGDLPMEIQPRLLRLLQEREYERLGETVTRQANIRLITATNRDLKRLVQEGVFREDLYFRLNVISVEIPPLRARRGDLERLTHHYIQHFAARFGRKLDGLTPEAAASLNHYGWPGNLRELRNVIERAVIMARESKITIADLPVDFGDNHGPNSNEEVTSQAGSKITLRKLEDMHIRRVLERSSNLAEAAEVLGINRTTLFRKRKEIGLD